MNGEVTIELTAQQRGKLWSLRESLGFVSASAAFRALLREKCGLQWADLLESSRWPAAGRKFPQTIRVPVAVLLAIDASCGVRRRATVLRALLEEWAGA